MHFPPASRGIVSGLALLSLLLATALPATPAQASSASLVLGGRAHPSGPALNQGLDAASQVGLSWVAIDLDWAAVWPTRDGGFRAAELDAFMQAAEERGLRVLLSLTHAPAWGMTSEGPDPLISAAVSLVLVQRYPAIGALELFPAANTRAGWGAPPNPARYLQMLETTAGLLEQEGYSLPLAAGGLAPATQPGDYSEAEFLAALYALNAAEWLQVVSLRPQLTLPGADGLPVVEAHELVRVEMLRNRQVASTIWITAFTWPESYRRADEQANWLERAYRALNAQLYIEMAFFDPLNPSSNSQRGGALVSPDGRIHPGLQRLLTLLQETNYAASLPASQEP